MSYRVTDEQTGRTLSTGHTRLSDAMCDAYQQAKRRTNRTVFVEPDYDALGMRSASGTGTVRVLGGCMKKRNPGPRGGFGSTVCWEGRNVFSIPKKNSKRGRIYKNPCAGGDSPRADYRDAYRTNLSGTRRKKRKSRKRTRRR